MKPCLPLILVLFLVGCYKKPDEVKQVPTLFEQLSEEQTGIRFSNQITESDSLNITNYEFMYNGGGVGIGDVNNDGLPDVYLTGNMTSSRLYLNRGKLSFEDITQKAGVGTSVWATGVSMADINQDGWLDIYVCVGGPEGYASSKNLLFINQQNGAFKEMAEAYGLADQGHSIHAAFVDYDQDGDLDVYVLTNYIKRNGMGPNILHIKQVNGEAPSTDRLYQNNGVGPNGHPTFTDVSRKANILKEGNGLGVAITDINRDGWPDIYVSNDFISNDIFWINNGDGTFTDKVSQYFKHQSYSSMGTDAADFNNDGLTDIISLDMLPETNERRKLMLGGIGHNRFESEMRMGYDPQYMRNTLQLNMGNGTDGEPIFSEIGQLSGVYSTEWSWAPLFADFDNDGYRDLYVTNGFGKDITNRDFIAYRREQSSQFVSREQINKRLKQAIDQIPGVKVANYGFRNNGDLTFANKTLEWGFSTPSFSSGVAFSDLDRDGDLDLVVNNINDPAFVYRNRASETTDNHYLQVKLKGNTPNAEGLGSKIELFYQGKYQFYEHSPYRGYQSSVDPLIHVGLGTHIHIDSLRIIWLDGHEQMIKNIQTNQVLLLEQKNASKLIKKSQSTPKLLFEDISGRSDLVYQHKEELYIDFNIQPLLPHKYSQNGPGIAVGDVNGDGLEDFFVGGAFKYPGCFFIHQPDGTFEKRVLTEDIKYEEDMGVLLFDADNDHDLDLYMVSGGSEFETDSPYYQDRLYMNDGKGNFKIHKEALPVMRASGSCVTACDFDKDGDLDLFVGGRVVPGAYPALPQSYLLRNDQGRFTDISHASGIGQQVGMVTSALWTDTDNDGWIDLMVVGEWMPVSIFKNNKGKFGNTTGLAGLSQSTGWWNSLSAGDFDNDGDVDYIAGNLGLNSKYKASAREPVRIIAKDFDGNGTLDPIMSHYMGGKQFPAHARDDMSLQMVGTKKRFTSYSNYAKADFRAILSGLDTNRAISFDAKTFETSYIENLGNGKFSLRGLPVEAQFAPAFGIVSDDIDQDGNLDVLMVGNSYATEVATGRYDAMYGLFMKGDGKGNFTPVSTRKAGFEVGGDAKGLALLYSRRHDKIIITAQNNAKLKAFKSLGGKQLFTFENTDVCADLILKNGRKRKHERYYGSTYLSQSSGKVTLDSTISQIQVTDHTGRRRSVNIE
jgi:hypothetical protein